MASTGTHPKPTPRSIAWCLLALLPLATAVGFDAAGTRPRPLASDNQPPPGLACDQ